MLRLCKLNGIGAAIADADEIGGAGRIGRKGQPIAQIILQGRRHYARVIRGVIDGIADLVERLITDVDDERRSAYGNRHGIAGIADLGRIEVGEHGIGRHAVVFRNAVDLHVEDALGRGAVGRCGQNLVVGRGGREDFELVQIAQVLHRRLEGRHGALEFANAAQLRLELDFVDTERHQGLRFDRHQLADDAGDIETGADSGCAQHGDGLNSRCKSVIKTCNIGASLGRVGDKQAGDVLNAVGDREDLLGRDLSNDLIGRFVDDGDHSSPAALVNAETVAIAGRCVRFSRYPQPPLAARGSQLAE